MSSIVKSCAYSSEVNIAGDFVPLIEPFPSMEIMEDIVRLVESLINSPSSE